MEKTVIANAIPSVINLDTARNGVVSVAGKTGEVIKTYAAALCQHFNIVNNQGNVTTPWYERKGTDKKPVTEERAKFVGAMQAAGFETPTIDVYWQRVKEASGRVKTQNKVTGGIDVDAENIKMLKTILNRIDTVEPEKAPLSNKVVSLLLMAADQMGIDTSAYAIGQDQE